MGIFDDIRTKGAAYRLTEEALYAEALREIESGQRRDGIWAKALAESEMDQGKAGAKYIKLRVQSLKDEVTLFIANSRRTESALNQVHTKPVEAIQAQPSDVAPNAQQVAETLEWSGSPRPMARFNDELSEETLDADTKPWLRVLKSLFNFAVVSSVAYYLIWYFKKYY